MRIIYIGGGAQRRPLNRSELGSDVRGEKEGNSSFMGQSAKGNFFFLCGNNEAMERILWPILSRLQ